MDPRVEDDEIPSLGTLIVRLGIGLFTLLIGFACMAWIARVPMEALGAWFVTRTGLVGLMISVSVVDALPLTHEPLLFLAWSGGLGFWWVWLFASIGSIMSGAIGWCFGRILGRSESLTRLFTRYRVTEFLERYGVWAVAIAAFTPFPFALVTWCSGAVGLPLQPVMLGSLFRAPKVLLYLTLIVYGWSLPELIAP